MAEPKKINVLRGRKISLENAKIIGTGATCTVYLLPDDNVIKVLNSTDFKEAEREIQLSKWAFAEGIPTAISYDVADVNGHPGLVYESLGRGNLRNELRDKPNEFIPIMESYLALIKKINSVTVASGQLPPIKKQILNGLKRTERYLSAEAYIELIRLVNTIPEDNHLIHGDCHIKNIKVQNGSFFLIDLDTLSTGDAIFELIGLCCCYNAYVNADENGYNTFFEIDDAIIKATYQYILDNYYPDISEDDKRENTTKIELLSYACMLFYLNPNDKNDRPCFDDMLAKVNERLFAVGDLILKR